MISYVICKLFTSICSNPYHLSYTLQTTTKPKATKPKKAAAPKKPKATKKKAAPKKTAA